MTRNLVRDDIDERVLQTSSTMAEGLVANLTGDRLAHLSDEARSSSKIRFPPVDDPDQSP